MSERLQKILARAGVASRRGAEKLIVEGRVRVNGRVENQLGVRVDPKRDRVELDGRRLVAEPLIYGVLHKPRGVVTTATDPQARTTVAELLKDVGVRVVPVGRLDYHTSGVLLFTNDGEFQSRLQHARSRVPRVYVAKVQGVVSDVDLERWRDRIEIAGGLTQPAEVRRLRVDSGKTWLEITLREGKNRHIRRLGEHAQQPVLRLARLSQAGITHTGLKPGQWRLLSLEELSRLKRTYDVPRRVRQGALDGPAQRRRGRPVRRPSSR